MTSTTIYTPIIPTYLYIKQHSVTGLKYFGKTTRPDPYKYLGSGVRWIRHINKHDKQFVDTLWVSDLYYDTSISEHALHFSHENNIVESIEWANLKPENGLDGGSQKGKTHSTETKAKMSVAKTGKTQSAEHIAKRVASHTGITLSAEHKAKLSAAKTGIAQSDEHKAKISASKTGKTQSAEHKAKRAAARRARNEDPTRKL